MKKKLYAIILTALMVTSCSVGLTACTSSATTELATEAATEPITEKATQKSTEPTTQEYTETATEKSTEEATVDANVEKAIKDNKLTVDENGNITDEKGNKLETNDKGEVQLKTADGKTITTKVDTIKYVNNGGNSISGSSSNKPNNTSSSSSSANNSSTSSSNSKPTSTPSSKPASSQTTSTKTWHEAEYKTVEHSAETTKVWVVDKAAYSYDEPVYEEQEISICNDCGANVMDNAFRKQHMIYEMNNGGKGSWRSVWQDIQVGTKPVTVQEVGHYETQIVKAAWSEKVLVKEGYWS